MKTYGIVRKVDELGRIVIPKEIREQFGISERNALEIFIDETEPALLLKKYSPGCLFCGDMDASKNFKGKLICKKCLAAAANL